jgi:hypothetical protein
MLARLRERSVGSDRDSIDAMQCNIVAERADTSACGDTPTHAAHTQAPLYLNTASRPHHICESSLALALVDTFVHASDTDQAEQLP